ncbi:MAG TPA: YbaB/EbfC family nucleoid-associated protein [Acidimicrobiia bacterium]|nr:YbaB/EbfC family nucleoid-associated protein [Acidimicrobiia bacterium]
MDRPPDMSQLLQQAQKMQQQMMEAQQELANRTYEGTAGGGAVKVVVNGGSRLLSVTLAPEIVDPSDPEMLGDLIQVATNAALEAAAAHAGEAMSGLTGGLDLGGLLG